MAQTLAQILTGETKGDDATRITASELLVNTPDPSSPEMAIKESQFPENLWQAAIAATRFGYGIRPGELQIIAQDPKGWLLRQIDDTSMPEEITGLSKSSSYLTGYMEAYEKRGRPFDDFMADSRQNAMYEIAQHELAAFNSVNPFRERLIRFWVNQFNWPGHDPVIYPMTVQFEREVIRPYLNRSYYHMLLAAYQHPAMLMLHSNDTSIAPYSPTGDRVKVQINESLAREILEKHTMGPEADFTESDITALASMLTGWSVGRLGSRHAGKFLYRNDWHDRNKKMFLKRIFPSAGMMEFEAAMDMVARSPRTGWRIADHMAREFITDTPSEHLLRDMVQGFLKSSGNIMGMAHAMIESPHAWTPVFDKVKTPQHLVISTLKALDYVPQNGRELVRHQTALGQPPFQPSTPAGWPRRSTHWVEPDLYADRLEWLTQMASENRLKANPVDQAIGILGPRVRPSTARHISVAPNHLDATAMLLTSPEFQRS